jgi:hypothetical protein
LPTDLNQRRRFRQTADVYVGRQGYQFFVVVDETGSKKLECIRPASLSGLT